MSRVGDATLLLTHLHLFMQEVYSNPADKRGIAKQFNQGSTTFKITLGSITTRKLLSVCFHPFAEDAKNLEATNPMLDAHPHLC